MASTSPRTASNRAFNKPATPKRINRRALIAAIILGLVAAVLIVSFLRGGGASGDGPAAPTLQVVVATQDIAAGREITESMVELKALPETAVLGNPATAKEQVVGQVLRYPVALGEQLVNLRLLENVKIQILSFQIPQGLRAFTIPVNVNSTPAALMAPGDFVDLLASGPLEALTLGESATVGSQDSNGGSNGTVTLFQNIQVLAVQQEYVDNGVPYDPSVRGAAAQGARVGSVTLALTPEQVSLGCRPVRPPASDASSEWSNSCESLLLGGLAHCPRSLPEVQDVFLLAAVKRRWRSRHCCCRLFPWLPPPQPPSKLPSSSRPSLPTEDW